MSLNLESCLTLTIVLATLYLSLCQGNTCDINSKPHPQGICGSRLSRAHSNLCFLLTQAYPIHFKGKRSTEGSYPVSTIYNIPLPVLADHDITSDNHGLFLNTLDLPHIFTSSDTMSGGITGESIVKHRPELSYANDMSRALIHLFMGHNSRSKRVAPQSSMVCDCCYNICTPGHLATYC